MKGPDKKLSNNKFIYVFFALMLIIVILKFWLSILNNIPLLLIWVLILFIPVMFLTGFILELLGKK